MAKISDPFLRSSWLGVLLVSSLAAGMSSCEKQDKAQVLQPRPLPSRQEQREAKTEPEQQEPEEFPEILRHPNTLTDLSVALDKLPEADHDARVMELIRGMLVSCGEDQQRAIFKMALEHLHNPFEAGGLLPELSTRNQQELVFDIVTKGGGDRAAESKEFVKALDGPELRDSGCTALLGFLKFDQSAEMRALVEELVPDENDRSIVGRAIASRFKAELPDSEKPRKGAELIQWLTGQQRDEVAIASAALSVTDAGPQGISGLAGQWGLRPDLLAARSVVQIVKTIETPADVGRWLTAVPSDDRNLVFYGSGLIQAAAQKFTQDQLMSLMDQVPEGYRPLTAENLGTILGSKLSANELQELSKQIPEQYREKFLTVLQSRQ